MRYADRLHSELRSLGLWRFLKFLYGRLFYRSWHSIVFDEPPEPRRTPSPWPPGYSFHFHDPAASLPPHFHQALAASPARPTLLAATAHDGIYIVTHGSEVASFGLVQHHAPQLSVLGLPPDAILIGNCVTLPDHRNQGLYRLALNDSVRLLRARNDQPIFIEVHPENRPSISGITRAGFRKIGAVHAAIWFNQFVYRQGRWHRLKKS